MEETNYMSNNNTQKLETKTTTALSCEIHSFLVSSFPLGSLRNSGEFQRITIGSERKWRRIVFCAFFASREEIQCSTLDHTFLSFGCSTRERSTCKLFHCFLHFSLANSPVPSFLPYSVCKSVARCELSFYLWFQLDRQSREEEKTQHSFHFSTHSTGIVCFCLSPERKAKRRKKKKWSKFSGLFKNLTNKLIVSLHSFWYILSASSWHVTFIVRESNTFTRCCPACFSCP